MVTIDIESSKAKIRVDRSASGARVKLDVVQHEGHTTYEAKVRLELDPPTAEILENAIRTYRREAERRSK